MKNFVVRKWAAFRHCDAGVTLVEYGIAVTLAIVLGVGALGLLAGDVGTAMGVAGDSMCATAPAAGVTTC